MTSQLVTVPVVLKKDCSDRQSLEVLGTVTETEKFWVIDCTAQVGYFLDDETFMYDFWSTAVSYLPNLTSSDLIRFDWDNVQKVKRALP
mgnify:CR=1 FL=1